MTCTRCRCNLIDAPTLIFVRPPPRPGVSPPYSRAELCLDCSNVVRSVLVTDRGVSLLEPAEPAPVH